MAKINLKDTMPTDATTEPNQNIADCDKHLTPYSKPGQFVDIAKISEVTMEQTDINTLAMAEEGNEENCLDVSNIMQNSQFYIDDSKISRKKKNRK